MTIRESRPEGAIVYWNCRPTPRQALMNELILIGMEDFTPCQRTPAAALKMALEEYCGEEADNRARKEGDEEVKRDMIVQSLLSQNVDGFEVIDVTRRSGSNNYICDFRAKVVVNEQDNTETLEFSGGYVSGEIQRHVSEWYEGFRSMLSGAALGGSLVDIVAKLGGVTLKDSGGIYWLPTEKLEIWQKVIYAFESCGSSQIYMMRTIMDDKTVRAVSDAIVDEVTKAAAEIANELRDNELGEKGVANRLERAKSLHDRVKLYEGIMDNTMKHLHDVITIAEMSAAGATAVQQDSDVFNEMFAEAN